MALRVLMHETAFLYRPLQNNSVKWSYSMFCEESVSSSKGIFSLSLLKRHFYQTNFWISSPFFTRLTNRNNPPQSSDMKVNLKRRPFPSFLPKSSTNSWPAAIMSYYENNRLIGIHFFFLVTIQSNYIYIFAIIIIWLNNKNSFFLYQSPNIISTADNDCTLNNISIVAPHFKSFPQYCSKIASHQKMLEGFICHTAKGTGWGIYFTNLFQKCVCR